MALTHSSYANEVKHQIKYNERQEFLGDAVLSIIVSDHLFTTTIAEGADHSYGLPNTCEKSLDVMANKIGLGQYLRLGHGEELTGGRTRPSIIADAFEALIAAILSGQRIESARKFVLPFVTEMLEHEDSLSFKDYKTILQEIIQQNPEEKLVYKLHGGREGPRPRQALFGGCYAQLQRHRQRRGQKQEKRRADGCQRSARADGGPRDTPTSRSLSRTSVPPHRAAQSASPQSDGNDGAGNL